ncbi:putative tRNA (cytidine(34)-2'-O)-methyltransferase [Helianthus annuus]|uniref:tRNA (Cytidine(34)-2'-O)-methyltransferase n=1 Tax=Helianthus annuus TaxID=4232 RepID=A0A9K3JVW4_HELAN|nr:putative tRNA (cytidine(34)-2'-O)-methyltransferase [Helianthus annuus]KAJ0957310.1 putative tRNA (cytidine(34)-2'-O)-methyltransferase [Helianthus annuus]
MATAGCLKTLDFITTPIHFRRSISAPFRLRTSVLLQFKNKFNSPLSHHSSSPLCSLSESSTTEGVVNGSKVSDGKLLQVVLVSPQIPGNTGCIARSCAASGVGLHLVEPLGFEVDDTKLKRAGLDYWPYVVVKVHSSWADFRDYFKQQSGEKRLLAFTKRGTNIHSDFSYKRGDWLVFGSETSGLPPEALHDCKNEPLGGGTLKIPMVETYLQADSEPCNDTPQLSFVEDVFA